MQGKEINFNEINESLVEAAEIFPEITYNRKKKHVSAHSLALLKQREELRKKGQVELARALTKTIKRQVRKDRREEIEELTSPDKTCVERWQVIKNLKRNYVPRVYEKTDK